MQPIITTYDFILLPVYLLIFYLIVRRRAKKYKAIGMHRHFVAAFWLRMAGAVFYGMLIQYYYGYGDSFGFYQGGNVISKMIQQDISSVKYLFLPADDIVSAAKVMGFGDDIPVTMPNDSNALVMKISAILSFFTFNKYLLISVCFGFFSFIGIWKLYYVFYQINNKKNVKLLAFFVLYFPSLWFWGSGLLKEPVCIGALGILIYSVFKIFKIKSSYIPNILLALLMCLLLLIIKSYIIVLLAISLVIVMFFYVLGTIKNKFFRVITILLCFMAIYIAGDNLNLDTLIENFVDNALGQIQTFQSTYQTLQNEDERSSATLMINNLQPSLQGIIVNSPAVIGTCLFRPFPWEAKKIIMFFSSLEAMLLLLATLYVLVKTYFFLFFKYLFNNRVRMFCFIFSMLFALLIGYTTFNFGTLIRYKIVFLPFYFFLLISIYTQMKERLNKNTLAAV